MHAATQAYEQGEWILGGGKLRAADYDQLPRLTTPSDLAAPQLGRAVWGALALAIVVGLLALIAFSRLARLDRSI